LKAFLVLLHTCGVEAPSERREYCGPVAVGSVDLWSLWKAGDEQLHRVLKRNGRKLVCSDLGIEYQAA
jgi:hypothetical protein